MMVSLSPSSRHAQTLEPRAPLSNGTYPLFIQFVSHLDYIPVGTDDKHKLTCPPLTLEASGDSLPLVFDYTVQKDYSPGGPWSGAKTTYQARGSFDREFNQTFDTVSLRDLRGSWIRFQVEDAEKRAAYSEPLLIKDGVKGVYGCT